MKKSFLTLALLLLPAIAIAQWKELPGPSAGAVDDICAITGTNGAEIYAATPNGVYRTTDSAKTWKLVGLSGLYTQRIMQYGTSGQEILFSIILPNGPYGNGNALLCKSNDSGRNWDTVFRPPSSSSSVFFGLAMAIDGNDVVVAVKGRAQDSAAGIYRSTDIGKTWVHQAKAPSSAFTIVDIAIGNNTIFSITAGANFFADTIWSMPSHGSQWQMTSYPYWHRASRIGFFGNDLFVGGAGRVDVSTDNGITWRSPRNFGLDTAVDQIYSFAVNGLTIVAAAPSAVFRSTDGASSWSRIDGSAGYPLYERRGPVYLDEIRFLNNSFYSATNRGLLTSSHGMEWEYESNGILGGVLAITSDGQNLFASTLRGIFHSSDRGQTWIAPRGSNDLVDSGTTGWQYLSLETLDGRAYAIRKSEDFPYYLPGLWRWNDSEWDLLSDSTIYGLTSLHGVLFASTATDVLRSTDSGATWNIANAAGLPNAVATLLSSDSLLFAFLGNGVYSSRDEGESWSLVSAQDHISDPFSAAYSGGTIYIVSTGSIFFSTDDGSDWDSEALDEPYSLWPFKDGIVVSRWYDKNMFFVRQNSVIPFTDSLLASSYWSFASDDSMVYVAGDPAVIYAAPILDLQLAVNTPREVQNNLTLSIFPNPTTSAGIFSFTIPKREHVSIQLYDELGVNHGTYFDGVAGSGETQVPFKVGQLAAGTYIAVLSTPEGSVMARIVVLVK